MAESKYSTNNVKTFDNEVVEIKLEDELTTYMDMQQFATADYSLAENAGMKKKIRTYHGTGDVQELAMGQGNTDDIGSYFTEKEYEVGTTQGRYQYYDEQLMNDPTTIDELAKHIREQMTNNMTAKIVTEFGKTSNIIYGAQFSFDDISDAIAAFPEELTEKQPLFLLVNRKDSTTIRKKLKDDLKYVEAFVRQGYVGTICGVPVYWNDAIPQGKMFLATKEAVTIFVKKGFEMETEREANVRNNKVYARKVMLVALTDEKKCIKISTGTDPRTGYVLVAAKPDDWDSKYATDYYLYDAAAETLALNTQADWTKVAGRIYEAE